MTRLTSRKRTFESFKLSASSNRSETAKQRVFILFETETEKDMELRYRLGVTLAQRQEMTCFTLYDVTDSKKQSEIGSYDEMIKKADKIVVLLTSSFNSSRMATSAFDFARNWCVERKRNNIVIVTKTKSVPRAYAQFSKVLMTKKSWIGSLISCLRTPDKPMSKNGNVEGYPRAKPLTVDHLYHDCERNISTSDPVIYDRHPHLPKHKLDAIQAFALLKARPADYKDFTLKGSLAKPSSDTCTVPVKLRKAYSFARDKATLQFLSRRLGSKRRRIDRRYSRRKTHPCFYSRSSVCSGISAAVLDAQSRREEDDRCLSQPCSTKENTLSLLTVYDAAVVDSHTAPELIRCSKPKIENHIEHAELTACPCEPVTGKKVKWKADPKKTWSLYWNRDVDKALLALQDLYMDQLADKDVYGSKVMKFCAKSELAWKLLRVKNISITKEKPKTNNICDLTNLVHTRIQPSDLISSASISGKDSKKNETRDCEEAFEIQSRVPSTKPTGTSKRHGRYFNSQKPI